MQANEPASSRRVSISDAFAILWSSNKCPIDRYYEESLKVRALYGSIEVAASQEITTIKKSDLPLVREMVFLRNVTAFEDYLKLLIGMCVSTLPCCKEAALQQVIPLAAVFSYSEDQVALGLVEGKSLSEPSDISKRLNTYLGINLDSRALDSLLTDLLPVLQLRHSLVHSLGILSAHDAVKLQAMESIGRRLQISEDLLADCLAVIDRAVRALNQTVLDRIEERWWLSRRLSGEFRLDQDLFSKLLRVFWSEHDNGPANLRQLYDSSQSYWFQRVGGVKS